ncbi:MAG: type II toxin-antitoxin system RelE/ParE family toxin [Microbacteriaceae bacterium]|nr:type II toxin-antitoxin system RelE/ParE family toxin [Microbacteriaceae bacterium]
MTFRVLITPAAERQLRKLDKPVAKRLLIFLREGLDRENPRRQGKQLVGSSTWRYRVGDYRILATIEDEVVTVTIVDVGHRRAIYRDSGN